MNSLIVIAHPKKESFSFAMAEKYMKLAKEKKYNIEVLDLYRDEHQQTFFTFGDANNVLETPETKYYQEKITWADEIILVFPYWWGGMPSILKNFFEWNLSKGFAFEYINSRPVGLLKGKNVKVYTTTGAPSFIYKILGVNKRFKKTLQKQIIEFCGMKLSSFNMYGGLDKSDTKPKEVLNKIII